MIVGAIGIAADRNGKNSLNERNRSIRCNRGEFPVQILVTNDDGIHAPGLAALGDALQELGDVQIVAPASEQSGVGLKVTYLHPLMSQEVFHDEEHFGWAVSGSPADCVKMGVLEYCPQKPQLVVSGINAGANAGINVLYSGTVAGAIEGAFFGITSIAVSLADVDAPHYAETARSAVELIRQILATDPPAGSLWNINFPHGYPQRSRGVKLVSLGVRSHTDVIEKRISPRGRTYYWSGFDVVDVNQLEPNTDVREIADGYVTISPLDFDITHYARLRDLEHVRWNLPGEE